MKLKQILVKFLLILIVISFSFIVPDKAHCWSSKKSVTWQNIGFRFKCENTNPQYLYYELYQYSMDYYYGYYQFAKYTGYFFSDDIKVLTIAAVPYIGRVFLSSSDRIAFTLKVYKASAMGVSETPCHIHNIFQTDMDHGHNNAVLGFRSICC